MFMRSHTRPYVVTARAGSTPSSGTPFGRYPSGRKAAVNEQGVAHLGSAEGACREEGNGGTRAAPRRAFWVDRPAASLVEVATDVLVADQVADVLHCREVAQAAGVDELRAMVGEDGFRVPAVDLIELGLGLPDGDELDAGAGDGRGPLRQLGQGSVRRLVEEDEEPRIERVSGVVVAIEGLADEVVEKNGEHDADAGLVSQWRGEVERVGTAEEPVEGDV